MSPAERISRTEAVEMLKQTDTAQLIGLADRTRRSMHGKRTYFVHSLNLNPSNICENRCRLCAFWRENEHADAYTMSLEQACRHIDQAVGWGLTDLHVVGGLVPELNLEYYKSLFAYARKVLGDVLIQGITAVEIEYLSRLEGLSPPEVLQKLKDIGLGAIPGGGAEIFAPDVRAKICENKISGRDWLAVHEAAHEIGLPTNATMLFGHHESPEDIVDHLASLRDLQDRTGGFGAFVALPFHAAGTHLDIDRGPAGHTTVRVVALARIFLDNFPHVRVLANYLDRKLLGVLLSGGADDAGGTSLDERIAKSAGAPDKQKFSAVEEMSMFLEGLGFEPMLVNSIYQPESEKASAQPVDTPALPTGRLSADEAIALHDETPFWRLGQLAHRKRLEMNDPSTTTFVMDRNISVTNICQAGCRFCAFSVEVGDERAFVLSVDQIAEKVSQAARAGATQVLLQGGLNMQTDLEFYEEVFSTIKALGLGDICVHSLSPTEIDFLAALDDLSVTDVLQRLRSAGLDSLPGGGAEILVDEVRQRVSPRKISATRWLEIMKIAQEMGFKTTATMVYGLGETTAQRVEHLMRIRELQDETGGFTAFIPWSYQSANTQLPMAPQSGVDYLRIVALARLILDNIPHIQAGWVTEGPDMAQLALSFGADDFGGVLMEEHVVKAAGASYAITAPQVISLIQEAGFNAAQRTTQYEILQVHDRPVA
ncbi:MAG: cyclic dehypoxanthinyl futalosine synthase [Phycisphaerae bacterium]|jgi:dehypoxanthine futalosine cyclase|nr:cyclic dehypoxanthinyl futalosine synthase [Phycisphaerae bacterium]